MFFAMGLHCTKSLIPVWFPVPVTDSSEKTELSASPNEAPSELSAPGSPSVSETKSKESSKKSKDLSPAGGKKTSIFTSFGHKLTKTKPKAVTTGTFHVPTVDVTTGTSIEDGFVLVEHASNAENNQGEICLVT